MKEFKGTPGKWEVKHSESKAAYNVVGTALGQKYKIARCPYLCDEEKKEVEANAMLIAAAPEMLNALQSVFELLEEHLPLWYLRKNYNEISQAINKALGK